MLYYRTIIRLKAIQVAYRLFYAIRATMRKLRPKVYRIPPTSNVAHLQLPYQLPSVAAAWQPASGTFTLLQLSQSFVPGQVNWSFMGHGKLWQYNLCYFEYLLQPNLNKADGIALMHEFVARAPIRSGAYEPYPVSLRLLFWIRFLTKHQYFDDSVLNASIATHVAVLKDNIEYHILGNHLLENGFALLVAGSYLQQPTTLSLAERILTRQLQVQVLADGGHFELSPMYQQILLYRALDAIQLIKNHETVALSGGFLAILTGHAAAMLGWLHQMAVGNHEVPHFNDSAPGIAPSTAALTAYAALLGIPPQLLPLGPSGYWAAQASGYSIVCDVGRLGPAYLPAHAHADMLSVVMYVANEPLLVNTGTSTYQPGARRVLERSTAAHNTVAVAGQEQSELWGVFRAARQARIHLIEKSGDSVAAELTNFNGRYTHRRTVLTSTQRAEIEDIVVSKDDLDAFAYFHFHPQCKVGLLQGNSLDVRGVRFTFSGAQVWVEPYLYADRYNQLVPASRVVVRFKTHLKTDVLLC
jgi:hypothetical protein